MTLGVALSQSKSQIGSSSGPDGCSKSTSVAFGPVWGWLTKYSFGSLVLASIEVATKRQALPLSGHAAWVGAEPFSKIGALHVHKCA